MELIRQASSLNRCLSFCINKSQILSHMPIELCLWFARKNHGDGAVLKQGVLTSKGGDSTLHFFSFLSNLVQDKPLIWI